MVEISPLISYAGEVNMKRVLEIKLKNFFMNYLEPRIHQRTNTKITTEDRNEVKLALFIRYHD